MVLSVSDHPPTHAQKHTLLLFPSGLLRIYLSSSKNSDHIQPPGRGAVTCPPLIRLPAAECHLTVTHQQEWSSQELINDRHKEKKPLLRGNRSEGKKKQTPTGLFLHLHADTGMQAWTHFEALRAAADRPAVHE